MADLADHDSQTPGQDDQAAASAAAALDSSRAQKRRAPEDDDDDDEKPGRERRKIDIKFITDKSRRHITFSKRKAGIMKKASLPVSFLAAPAWSGQASRTRCFCHVIDSSYRRPTSCRYLRERKSYSWWCQKQVLCIPSRLRSSSRWLQSRRART